MSQILSTLTSLDSQSTTPTSYADPVTRVLCGLGNIRCESSYESDESLQNIKGYDIENLDFIKKQFEPIDHGASFPIPEVSDKSLSLLGIIGGFTLTLLFLAFITCVRQRKLYQVKSFIFGNFIQCHRVINVFMDFFLSFPHKIQNLILDSS